MNAQPLELIAQRAAAWIRHITRPDRWRSGPAFADRLLLFGQEVSLFDGPTLSRLLFLNGHPRTQVIVFRLHPLRSNIAGVRVLVVTARFTAPLVDATVVAGEFAYKPPELQQHRLISVGDTVYADTALDPLDPPQARRDWWRRLRLARNINRRLADAAFVLARFALLDALLDPPTQRLRTAYVAALLREDRLADNPDLASWLTGPGHAPDPEARYQAGLTLAFPRDLDPHHLQSGPDIRQLEAWLGRTEGLMERELCLPLAGESLDARRVRVAFLRQELADGVQEYGDGTRLISPGFERALRSANAGWAAATELS